MSKNDKPGLAELLARALYYVDQRQDDGTHDEDDDMRFLESVAADLQNLSRTDRDVLAESLVQIGGVAFCNGLGLTEDT